MVERGRAPARSSEGMTKFADAKRPVGSMLGEALEALVLEEITPSSSSEENCHEGVTYSGCAEAALLLLTS